MRDRARTDRQTDKRTGEQTNQIHKQFQLSWESVNEALRLNNYMDARIKICMKEDHILIIKIIF